MPLVKGWRRSWERKGLYLAAAGFGVAWWIFYVDVLGFGPGRRIEIYDPLRRWWSI